ncbi:MAG: lysozyme inhibitor LprI family protein [Pseudomonadota bacterium]
MKSVAFVLYALVMCASCRAEVQPENRTNGRSGAEPIATVDQDIAPDPSPSAAAHDRGLQARHQGVRESYWQCVHSDDRALLDKSFCTAEETEFQDRRLNAVYQRLSRKVDGEQRALLLASQRSWLDFRAKDQELEVSLFGSEQIENLQISEREMLRISDRADALEFFESISQE